MEKKRTVLMEKLTKLIPGQEREFLVFMGGTSNSFINWEEKSLEELLNSFIEFEEENNEVELTKKIINQLLKIYIPGFINGEEF
jgi:hypothetical protein